MVDKHGDIFEATMENIFLNTLEDETYVVKEEISHSLATGKYFNSVGGN